MNIRRRKHCCCPAQQVSSPTQITSSSGGEEQRNKSATPHAHPNRIQLTCPPCNRPTLIDRHATQKEEQTIQQLANHQQIKQHHNHQSTSHPPHHHRHHPSSTIHQQQPPFAIRLDNNNHHQQERNIERESARFSKRSPHTSKKSSSVAKRICRFSAAAPSAQCIESPRSHLILDNKPHTRTKSRGLQTTPRQFTQEEEEVGDGTEE